MDEHTCKYTCKHEVDIALMSRSLDENTRVTKENHDFTKDIHSVLYRNGFITKIAVQGSAIKRIWWWLGILSVSVLGIAVKKLI